MIDRDEVIRMAREADQGHAGAECEAFGGGLVSISTLERFAALVYAAGQRDMQARAAEVCIPKSSRPCDCDVCDCGNSGDRLAVAMWDTDAAMAKAIRALEIK